MIWKEIRDGQLFVFFNGELIYKKWFKTGQSIVKDLYGIVWSPKCHDRIKGT
jgi:hypothetical protein